MVGRIALLWVNTLVGEKRVIYLYGILAIGYDPHSRGFHPLR